MRIAALGIRLFLAGRTHHALTVFKSALRELGERREPEARATQGMVFCWIAQAYSHAGLFSQAFGALQLAEEIPFGWKGESFEKLKNQAYQVVHYRAGNYEEAFVRSLNLALRSESGTTIRELGHLFAGYFLAGRCAILLDRRGQARRLLARLESRSNGRAHPFLRACVCFLRGDLEQERGTPGAYRSARRHYHRAERLFGRFAEGDQIWIRHVRFSLGLLGLRERKVGEVLKQAEFALELGRETGMPAAQAQGLLLKSLLLLEEKAPRDEIYEEIIRSLGLVQDPVVLFRILANLYIYSWDLGDRLDLTDLHLRQLNQLKASIPPATYDPLYEACVTRKVLARLQRRLGLVER
ncbi:MAG: hypothetical protein ACRD2T_02355, partial [Thermoanaerobaculia bacterium]